VHPSTDGLKSALTERRFGDLIADVGVDLEGGSKRETERLSGRQTLFRIEWRRERESERRKETFCHRDTIP